jgi:hypothetical protein
MDDLWLKVLPGILVAILSSWLSARWALKKFYAERWWDRREKAYSEIINALYDLVQYFSAHKEDYGQGTGYSKEKEIELYQHYEQSYWALKKAKDISVFYISEKAQAALVELSKREQLDFDQNPPWDLYEQEFHRHREALNKFIAIAKSDLGGNRA